MAYCEVPDNIDLQLMDRTDESTLGGEHNGVFFTRDHLVARLRFHRVLRVEPPISTRPLIGRAVYNLFSENRAGRPDVYVGSEPPTLGC